MGAILQYRPRPRTERPIVEPRPHDAVWIMDVGAWVLGLLGTVAAVWLVVVFVLSLRVAS